MMLPGPSIQLVVFADDWGRHPSSSQHLVRHLLPRHPTLWVNTIGTRRPGLSAADLGKVAAKVRQWLRPAPAPDLPGNLHVISPRMWPGFRSSWQRRFNRGSITRAVTRALGPHGMSEYRVAVTTLPITADLVGELPVDRWVYYCVDDFSVWPGLDASVMQEMEQQLASKVDHAIAVSDTLQTRLSAMGRSSELLTHGIDLEHWSAKSSEADQSAQIPSDPASARLVQWLAGLPHPILLFWGLVDRRLDTAWCQAAAAALGSQGTLVLVGPQQNPDPALASIRNLVMPGPAAYQDLPALAGGADVLIMPYGDAAVTRAMQPLKFKEYLAAGYPDAGKPVVVRRLPATEGWSDAADVVATPETFVAAIRERLQTGVPVAQREARRRLEAESWKHKAEVFQQLLIANLPTQPART